MIFEVFIFVVLSFLAIANFLLYKTVLSLYHFVEMHNARLEEILTKDAEITLELVEAMSELNEGLEEQSKQPVVFVMDSLTTSFEDDDSGNDNGTSN